jgi:uncharacterized membrane protein YqiK
MYVAVTNTHRQPVTITDEGHQLGGGEYAAVDDSDERVQRLMEIGHLRVLPRYGTEHPSVCAAYMEADAKNAAAEESAQATQQQAAAAEAKAQTEAVLAEADQVIAQNDAEAAEMAEMTEWAENPAPSENPETPEEPA